MFESVVFRNSPDLNMLLKALNNVKCKYLKGHYYRNRASIQRIERVFCAELYHQLRLLQKINDPFIFHSEIGKRVISREAREILTEYLDFRCSPDLVYHLNQNDCTPENQRFALEVKLVVKQENEMIKDLYKLISYKISSLAFQEAVFVCPFDQFKIEQYLKLRENNKLKKLCVEHKILFAFAEECRDSEKLSRWKLYHIT